MPKVRDFLAPLREVQSKAEGLVSKSDATVFARLGVFISGDAEAWKAPFRTSIREATNEHRSKTLTQLRLHSQLAQTLQASAQLDEGYSVLGKKLNALNLEFEKLFDVFERCLPLFCNDDPRRKFILEEMKSIQSSMACIEESEAELQDELPAIKRSLQFLVLPEARFETFVEPLRQQAGLADSALLDAKLDRLTCMWRSRHECFEEIQSVLVDAANKWLDQEVAPTEQRKALREAQRLYKKLRSQVETQDKLLSDIEQFRDWAIEAPIFLTDDGLGMIEVSQLLSVLEEYKDVSEASGVFSMLDYLLEKVSTFAAELEDAACV